MEFMPKLEEELDEIMEGSPWASSAVTFLKDILGLISFSNMRNIHNSTAAVMANRQALRQQVMGKLVVPPKTAQMLKNSSFVSEGVFGELPKSFLDKLSGWSGNHLVARDKRKYNNNVAGSSGGRGRGQKRQGSAAQPNAKRGKYSNSNNNFANYTPAQNSVFSHAGTNPRGGGSNRAAPWKAKAGGRGRAKN